MANVQKRSIDGDIDPNDPEFRLAVGLTGNPDGDTDVEACPEATTPRRRTGLDTIIGGDDDD